MDHTSEVTSIVAKLLGGIIDATGKRRHLEAAISS